MLYDVLCMCIYGICVYLVYAYIWYIYIRYLYIYRWTYTLICANTVIIPLLYVHYMCCLTYHHFVPILECQQQITILHIPRAD